MDFFFKEITHSLQLKHLEYVEIWEADLDMATKILSSFCFGLPPGGHSLGRRNLSTGGKNGKRGHVGNPIKNNWLYRNLIAADRGESL